MATTHLQDLSFTLFRLPFPENSTHSNHLLLDRLRGTRVHLIFQLEILCSCFSGEQNFNWLLKILFQNSVSHRHRYILKTTGIINHWFKSVKKKLIIREREISPWLKILVGLPNNHHMILRTQKVVSNPVPGNLSPSSSFHAYYTQTHKQAKYQHIQYFSFFLIFNSQPPWFRIIIIPTEPVIKALHVDIIVDLPS